jgi:hypothetical protein
MAVSDAASAGVERVLLGGHERDQGVVHGGGC